MIGLLFALYAISVGFILGGVGSFFGTIVSPFLPYSINVGMHPITSISFGIGLTSLGGVLIMIGSFYLTKLLYQGTIKYLRWNINIIKDRGDCKWPLKKLVLILISIVLISFGVGLLSLNRYGFSIYDSQGIHIDFNGIDIRDGDSSVNIGSRGIHVVDGG